MLTVAIQPLNAENHILKPTAARGDFLTLNGKRVVITGSEVQARAGFEYELAARVLGTERIPVPVGLAATKVMPDGTSVTAPTSIVAYFISRPLEGGLDAPATVDDMDHRSIVRYAAALQVSIPCSRLFITSSYLATQVVPEAEVVFAALDDTVAHALDMLAHAASAGARLASRSSRATDSAAADGDSLRSPQSGAASYGATSFGARSGLDETPGGGPSEAELELYGGETPPQV
jgi:hypothetical protein